MFLRCLGPLLKTMLLIGNLLKPLVKIALITLGLMATASAIDAATRKKIFRFGFTTLIIPTRNE